MRWSAAGAGLLLGTAVLARRHYARTLARETTGAAPKVRADDGVLLHLERDGQGSGPVLVFVHGFASSLREYDEQRSRLRHEYPIVLFDQRGHGRSGWGDYRRATVDQLGADLDAVVEQSTGDAPVVLVGHSLGGMAVLALAARRPELFGSKVVGVALLSTSAGRLVRAELPGAVARLARATGLARAAVWGLWLIAPIVERLRLFGTDPMRHWLAGRLFGGGVPAEWAVDRMQHLWMGTSRAMAAAFYPSMVLYAKAAAASELGTVPTLVLTGTEDATIPARHTQRLVELIGEAARLVEVPGAGHMVNLTHADQVNDALEQLLRRVERPEGAL